MLGACICIAIQLTVLIQRCQKLLKDLLQKWQCMDMLVFKFAMEANNFDIFAFHVFILFSLSTLSLENHFSCNFVTRFLGLRMTKRWSLI